MIWDRIGFVPVPKTGLEWMRSHCQLPTALPLDDQRVRVFFASRTADQHSHIGYVDLAFDETGEHFSVGNVSAEPVLSPGPLGYFDEHGVYPSSIVSLDNRHYLFYVGWNRGAEAPLFYASIGLAVSCDGYSFERYSSAPVLARSEFDPCLVTSPHVYVRDGRWRMTYVSGIGWSRGPDGRLQSRYHLKSAWAASPGEWRREGKVAIELKPGEDNVARAAVQRALGGGYEMWYCYAGGGHKYRIGYAVSPDGETWRRIDELAGIGPDTEHSSEMICYPCVFQLKDRRYLLFNGDQFGLRGFGVAIQRP